MVVKFKQNGHDFQFGTANRVDEPVNRVNVEFPQVFNAVIDDVEFGDFIFGDVPASLIVVLQFFNGFVQFFQQYPTGAVTPVPRILSARDIGSQTQGCL